MSNDIFGGLMKGLGAFMPKDDPNVKLFQSQNEISDLQNRELELYAEIGKKAFPAVRDQAEYGDLVQELTLVQKKLVLAKDELRAAQNSKTEQEQKEQEALKSRTCPDCGTVNPEGVKFCKECGAKMILSIKLTCSGCSAEYPAGTRFCGECGMKL